MSIENPLLNVELHTHNGLDSPKVKENSLFGAIDKTTVVLLTTAQTIADIKTFTSIPILPASNPTTDNQAVRKAYVDSALGATETIASDNLRDSADTTRNSSDLTYTKYKDITMNEGDGIVRVKFEFRLAGESLNAYARIYKNGVAVGTERIKNNPTFEVFSEDIAFSSGDEIQFYLHNENGGSDAQVKNFRLYYDKVFTVTVGTVNQN